MDAKERLIDVLDQEIEEKRAAGTQLILANEGIVIFSYSNGLTDMNKGRRPNSQSIYRIYSMTKPVTAVIAAMLNEAGLLDYSKPIAEYLPEFSTMKVLKDTKEIPCRKLITVWDLLNMTSGIVYPDSDPIGLRMNNIFLPIQEKIMQGKEYSTEEIVQKIATCPLAFEPGTAWRYGFSADVLGRIIEVVSGKNLRDIFREKLFDPLGMNDTDFYVPEEKRDRLVVLYKKDNNNFIEDNNRHLGLTDGRRIPKFLSGGAGLYTTMSDYSNFLSMLSMGGVFQGRRYLLKETVDNFSKNQLTSMQLYTTGYLPQMQNYGYGHLMRVYIKASSADSLGYEGEFGWDGWTGPYFSVDLKHHQFILYMTQISGYSNWNTIYSIRNHAFNIFQNRGIQNELSER